MNEFYLNVDSLDRQRGDINNFFYQYTSRNVNYNEPYLVSLKKLEFPTGCIYQINQSNNVFNYNINSTNVNLTIEPGNYTINELLNLLNTDIESTISSLVISNFVVTLSYSNVYNKVGIIETGTNAGSNTCTLNTGGSRNIAVACLGLTSTIVSTTSIQYLQNQVDVSPLDYVFLRCSQVQSTSFINDRTQSADILYRIQLASQRNSKVYIDDSDLKNNQVLLPKLNSNFNFYLTDKNGNLINTNGLNYSFQLRFVKLSP